MSDYMMTEYRVSVRVGADVLMVEKASWSDGAKIKMRTNDGGDGEITIKSRDMAENLHFMLGQMLRKSNKG